MVKYTRLCIRVISEFPCESNILCVCMYYAVMFVLLYIHIYMAF